MQLNLTPNEVQALISALNHSGDAWADWEKAQMEHPDPEVSLQGIREERALMRGIERKLQQG
jgi:hypothetical protein